MYQTMNYGISPQWQKKLNSSKNNKLPERRYIKDFVEYNYYLYSLIFANGNKDQAAILKHYFDRCENQHLNAIWATEKLYIPGNTERAVRQYFGREFGSCI